MQIPLVDLKAQYAGIKSEIEEAIRRILDNTSFIMGKEVSSFEEAFASYVQTAGAAGVASGTAALHLAIRAAGIMPGDEVITTAHTFVATAEAISMCGAKPVFVDIDEQTYCMDPRLIEKAISPSTRAIIPVHLYGHPAAMNEIMDIANRHNLLVIEDAAQAHGAEFSGKRCGSIGQIGCFSFYPGKNLGCYGDGGAVTSNDPMLLSGVKRLRDHGRSTKYLHEELGYGERLDALQAAILSVKLLHLEEWTEQRRRHAKLYNELLANTDVITPYAAPEVRHVYHLYVIRTMRRDKILEHLKTRGTGAGIHYPVPLHRQPAYLKLGYGNVSLPVTEKVVGEIISLPIYPELDPGKIEYVVRTLREVTD